VQQKTVIVIAGATAVGKTAVGIDVAKHFQTEIISADSRQCYKELRIGVARPSATELAQVPHHFIASHSIHEKITAATFEEYALAKAHALFKKQDVVVMVGGTGLYINAFCEGMDEIPEVPEAIHQQVVAAYEQNGLAWLQAEIQKLDPQFWQKGETKNPQRMMRALEVVKASGRSVYHFRKGEKKQRDFSVIKIGLELPKEQLHRNINQRVDNMLREGLVEEVKTLLPYQHLNALQTVGYKEIFHSLGGHSSIAEATEAIKQNTRHYAKRQLTWFRKDAEYHWHAPDPETVIPFLQAQLP
jgi:tRNA dimethylallyltransferase